MRILTQENSIASYFLAQLRDQSVQKDSMRFRRNLERLGEIMAYEISKTLPYSPQKVQTPLAETIAFMPAEFPVLATVLRAGLPFHQGFLNYFDASESAFVAAYRIEKTHDLQIQVDYLTSVSLEDKILLLVDPMLATGKSLALTYQAMLRFGMPRETHIAACVASPEGIAHIQQELPNVKIWLGALDEKLNERSYIIPGLGDAGNLAYGAKI
ncbi:uracil phosphoribosyltransferase [Adhaeribacter sp. BT258]|uniref:Uracil phosphoribosyltransferase n=1 Tax=Adhaeribacter terrigena TaxID=2793070 RepID=A0ABS1C275_9BACT|nr:uracil phosphoribosyltransferase [Adhaeribacter terrigena]MBK0403418.1 uracil phosphoribosyltransferase [Adhaeribacter terrigena]